MQGNLIGLAADGATQLSATTLTAFRSASQTTTHGRRRRAGRRQPHCLQRPGRSERPGNGVWINNSTGNTVRGNSIYSNGNPIFSDHGMRACLDFNVPPE